MAQAATAAKPTTTAGMQAGTVQVKSIAANKVNRVAKDIKAWLGEDARMIINKKGDKVFISKDGTRIFRADIIQPKPHLNPHAHFEYNIGGKWINHRIYPIDVLPF